MVAVGRDEHLRLVAQAAEGDRMDDPVAVALEDVARAARARCPLPDAPGRAIVAAARQAPGQASFERQFPDRLAGPAGPAKSVDVERCPGPRRRYWRRDVFLNGPISSRTRLRLFGDIAADAVEQVAGRRLIRRNWSGSAAALVPLASCSQTLLVPPAGRRSGCRPLARCFGGDLHRRQHIAGAGGWQRAERRAKATRFQRHQSIDASRSPLGWPSARAGGLTRGSISWAPAVGENAEVDRRGLLLGRQRRQLAEERVHRARRARHHRCRAPPGAIEVAGQRQDQAPGHASPPGRGAQSAARASPAPRPCGRAIARLSASRRRASSASGPTARRDNRPAPRLAAEQIVGEAAVGAEAGDAGAELLGAGEIAQRARGVAVATSAAPIPAMRSGLPAFTSSARPKKPAAAWVSPSAARPCRRRSAP